MRAHGPGNDTGGAGTGRGKAGTSRLTWGSKIRDSGGWLSRNRVTGVSKCSSSTTAQSGENRSITFTRASIRAKCRHRPQPREMAPARSAAPRAQNGRSRTPREMAPARAPVPSRPALTEADAV